MLEFIARFSNVLGGSMVLAWIVTIVGALLILVSAIIILVFVATFIHEIIKLIIENVFLRSKKALNSWCESAKATSNPLGIILAGGFFAFFFNLDKLTRGNLNDFWKTERVLGLTTYKAVAFGFLGLFLLYSIIRYRLKLPKVFLAKFLRIPLFVAYIPFGILFIISGIFEGDTNLGTVGDTVVATGGSNGTYVVGKSGPVYTASSDDSGSYSGTESGSGSSYDSSSSESGSSDGFSYLGDHHNKDNAEAAGGSNGYEYTSSTDSTQYYNGDYHPFNTDGTTTESYHLDEGCSPMDN